MWLPSYSTKCRLLLRNEALCDSESRIELWQQFGLFGHGHHLTGSHSYSSISRGFTIERGRVEVQVSISIFIFRFFFSEVSDSFSVSRSVFKLPYNHRSLTPHICCCSALQFAVQQSRPVAWNSVACIHSSSLTTRMMRCHLTFYSPLSILVSQMVPRSRRDLTPRPHMSNNSTPLIVGLPSMEGDPLRSPTTYSNSPSKLIPATTHPHRRNGINLTRSWLILYSHMTTRGPIQRLRLFPINCLDLRILLACPLVHGQLTLFLTTLAHIPPLYVGVSHLYIPRTLFARSRCITPHQHTVRYPPMPHPNSLKPPRSQVHQHYTNIAKIGQ